MKQERGLRVGELMRHALGEIFVSPKYTYRNQFLTVTEVRLSRDSKVATVWVSVLGEMPIRIQAINRLIAETGRIRKLLTDRVILRTMPELVFKLDTTLDNVERINELLVASGMNQDSTPVKSEDD